MGLVNTKRKSHVFLFNVYKRIFIVLHKDAFWTF